MCGPNKTIRKTPSAATNRKLNEVNSQQIDFLTHFGDDLEINHGLGKESSSHCFRYFPWRVPFVFEGTSTRLVCTRRSCLSYTQSGDSEEATLLSSLPELSCISEARFK